MGDFLVTGDFLQLYDCSQLFVTLKAVTKREQELKDTISKVGPIAAVVGGYQADYFIQHGNVAAVQREMAAKNCHEHGKPSKADRR
jgi:hypothetical protein